MPSREELQDEQYEFPYHHLVQRGFSETRHLPWGYEYASYLDFLIETLVERNPKSLLDIGCGEGKLILELESALPSTTLTGIDFSERAIAFARAFCPDVTFEVARLETLAARNATFDAFTSVEVIEHIPPDELPGFLSTASKILSPGGVGIITTPSTNRPLVAKHYQHFDEEKLRTLLSPHFEILEIGYLNKKAFGVEVIQRLLANRLFILNQSQFVRSLYRLYKKKYLRATPSTGQRVYAIVTTK
ncbi:MAG: class I SAM-dependent methyltransferase [Bacillota bacterium]